MPKKIRVISLSKELRTEMPLLILSMTSIIFLIQYMHIGVSEIIEFYMLLYIKVMSSLFLVMFSGKNFPVSLKYF